MKNGDLEKLIKDIDAKIDKIIDDMYCEEEKIVETTPVLSGITNSTEESLMILDVNSYDEICKYLKTEDIPFMGIT